MTATLLPLQRCIDCNNEMSSPESYYSTHHYSLPLCKSCQLGFKTRYKKATKHAIQLYIAIRLKNIHARLEECDGHKRIDIVIKSARIHIEVDGFQHHFRPSQALADLKRTYHSLKDGYVTIHIPNTLIRKHLDTAASYIANIVNDRKSLLKAS